MDLHDASTELLDLIGDTDARAGVVLCRHGAELARDVEHRLRPIGELVDELDMGGAPDERAVRAARDAVEALYGICARLPGIEDALDSSTFDRLRALSVDLKLAAR